MLASEASGECGVGQRQEKTPRISSAATDENCGLFLCRKGPVLLASALGDHDGIEKEDQDVRMSISGN